MCRAVICVCAKFQVSKWLHSQMRAGTPFKVSNFSAYFTLLRTETGVFLGHKLKTPFYSNLRALNHYVTFHKIKTIHSRTTTKTLS